jgi:ribosomal protein L37AE/L43A
MNKILALPQPAPKKLLFYIRLTQCHKCHKQQIRLIAEHAANWGCRHCGATMAIEPGMQQYA